MEIIQNFGINPVLLGAQIINFLILLYLLKRFAYKPLFKMLEDRKKTIAEGLKNAEQTKLTLDKALEEEKKILKKAQEESAKILAESKTQADTLVNDAREKAKTEVASMIREAKAEIDREAKETEKGLTLSVATLAVDMLKDSLKDVFTAKEQEEVVHKLTKKIKMK